MLRICEITQLEWPALRAMAEAFRREITPDSPVVRDPAYRARYFEARFTRDADRSCQWWAKVNETIVGFANVERGEKEAGESFGCVKDLYDKRTRMMGSSQIPLKRYIPFIRLSSSMV